jgi:tetratricopeptide (TPR) repeat protein/transcriptional regulator with XRE-family HTH domain
MFGDLVRAQRQRLGLTQAEVADRSGLGVRTVRKLEAGQVQAPRPPTVRLLADTFGLTGPDRDQFCRAAAGGAAGEPAALVTPAQLPPDLPWFTGRERQLAALDALAGAPPTGTRLCTLSGTAGVGKSALAVHWAHRVADRFPDGQLYLNLRGFDLAGRVLTPAEAVPVLLAALGVPAGQLPPDVDAQVGLYRSLLAGRRMLVVLDNARHAGQVRPLLPGTPAAVTVVTSRVQLTGLVAADDARPLTLDLLTPAEARQVLDRRLGAGRVAAEPGPVEQIIAACAGLPLALAVAAARVLQTDFPVAAVAAELGGADRRLDALGTGDPANEVRTVFSWSYTALTAPAARLFRLLGLHPGPEVSAAAAASLAGQPVPETRRLLTELARANLVTGHRSDRYALHDLLRAYAADLAGRHDPEDARRAALVRLLDHYTHTAHAADRLLSPLRGPIPLPLAAPAAGACPERLPDLGHAAAWLAAEHQVLLAALRHAADAGLDLHTWQLGWALHTFLDRRGVWHDFTRALRTAVAAADRLGDPVAQAYAHRVLASAYLQVHRYDEAHVHLRHALARYAGAGDQAGQASTHSALAFQWERQGQPRQALEHARQALALNRAAGQRSGEAYALNTIGWCHATLGDLAAGLEHCERAVALFEQLGDRYGQANGWDSIGYVHRERGEPDQAVRSFRRAIALFSAVDAPYQQAASLDRLGDTHRAAGDTGTAGTAWRQALDLFTALERAEADAVRGKLRDLTGGAAAGR